MAGRSGCASDDDADFLGASPITRTPIADIHTATTNKPCNCRKCVCNALVFGVVKVQLQPENGATQMPKFVIQRQGGVPVGFSGDKLRRIYKEEGHLGLAAHLITNGLRALTRDVGGGDVLFLDKPRRKRSSPSTPKTPAAVAASSLMPVSAAHNGDSDDEPILVSHGRAKAAKTASPSKPKPAREEEEEEEADEEEDE